MVNSIKEKLDKADTISEIRLMLGHSKDTVCVVVEGADDQKLFRPLLSENVQLFQSYASKNGVDEIDMVMNIGRFMERDYDYVVNEIRSVADTAHKNGILLKPHFSAAALTDIPSEIRLDALVQR